MRLNKIDIQNYKGFERCEVNFDSHVNVFIGNNASGKTTVLTAILKSVYNITRHFAPINKHRELNLTNDDIHYNADYCIIDATVSNFLHNKSPIRTIVHTKSLSKEKQEEIRAISEGSDFPIKKYEEEASVFPFTVPIFKFYPANRGGLAYVDKRDQKIYFASQLETWSNVYQDSISYSRFFSWFFEHETDELRLQRDKKDFTYQSVELYGIRIALGLAFQHLGYGNNIKIKSTQIKRQGNSRLTPGLVLENTETKLEESFDNKSDGEKSIITLVADIAYNLSLAKDFRSDSDFLKSPGIVLIDEIETHLHPTWQRKIVPMLTSVFPNLQLFIATHSPQIVGSVKSENVFICDNFKIGRAQLKTKGEDTNSLLKYIFNSTERPKEYNDLLKEFYSGMENKLDSSAR